MRAPEPRALSSPRVSPRSLRAGGAGATPSAVDLRESSQSAKSAAVLWERSLGSVTAIADYLRSPIALRLIGGLSARVCGLDRRAHGPSRARRRNLPAIHDDLP